MSRASGDPAERDRRSWWLREALAIEAAGGLGYAGGAAAPAPPLRGTVTADVVILGGGYTGLWTALRVQERDPGARVVLLEADICGGGPSGRNGGFITGWWDEMPTLIERYGDAGALSAAWAMDGGGRRDRALVRRQRHRRLVPQGRHDLRERRALPGRGVGAAVRACERLGVGDRYVAMTPAEVHARVASPVLRGGAFMPGAATVQPAFLARGLRRVAARARHLHPRGDARDRARRGATGLGRVRSGLGGGGHPPDVPVARSASARRHPLVTAR